MSVVRQHRAGNQLEIKNAMPMKMLLEDAASVLALCWRIRQTTSHDEIVKLMVAIANSFDKLSEPMLFAAEDAFFYGLCGQEREGATPLKDLAKLASMTDERYVSPEDAASTSPTTPPAHRQGGTDA
jgi:hypothetical protein